MQNQILNRQQRGLALLIFVGLIITLFLAGIRVANAQDTGIICTTGTLNGTNRTITLETTTGYIGTPDDNIVFMWGYAENGQPFQHPSPNLCVNEGETVTVILHNTLPADTSIIFPGQNNVLANGVPAQPQFDGGGTLTSMTDVATANGGSVTYSFVAENPGTFVYQSGTNPDKQVRLGLFGALIVRPTDHPDWVNNEMDELDQPLNTFHPDREFMIMLSEIDPLLNQAVESGQSFDLKNYQPRYWLINGRGFPDSLAPNFASWLPSQPYGALQLLTEYDPGTNPDWSLVRYIAFGTVDIPMHPHGKSAHIVGRDGSALAGPNGEDLSFEAFSIPMGPGQTWDGLMRWDDTQDYDEVDNPVTVDIPAAIDVGFGPLYSGSPYLGQQGNFPVDFTTLNQCGEYYHISHVHALHKITSWGTPMTGPITFMRVDPPAPNNCNNDPQALQQLIPANVTGNYFCSAPKNYSLGKET